MNVNQGGNKYCAPAVLSILTGLSTDEAAREIAKTTGTRGEIKAVYLKDLIATIERQGLKAEKEITSVRTTLFGVCYFVYDKPGIYLVELPRHVVAIEVTQDRKVYFCDNHTKESIKIESSARLSQKVEALYKIKVHLRFISRFEYITDTCKCCGHTETKKYTYKMLPLKMVA